MFKEDDFEECKDWIIRTETKEYYCLPNKTRNELYQLLNDESIRFIEVLTLYDKDRMIIPMDRIVNIREGE